MKELILYEFLYTDDIYESGMITISIHYTKNGAYKALRECILNKYNEWYEERILWGKKYRKGEKAMPYERWGIKSIEVKE